MTLTAFVWTTQYPGDPTSLRAYVALFDLNQWYHSQMLSKVVWRTRKGPGERSPLLGCGYFAFFALVGKDRRLGHQEVSALLVCVCVCVCVCIVFVCVLCVLARTRTCVCAGMRPCCTVNHVIHSVFIELPYLEAAATQDSAPCSRDPPLALVPGLW